MSRFYSIENEWLIIGVGKLFENIWNFNLKMKIRRSNKKTTENQRYNKAKKIKTKTKIQKTKKSKNKTRRRLFWKNEAW